MSQEDIDAEVKELQERIQINKRRLWVLQRQAAYSGINTPPHITLEIEDVTKEIAKLEDRVKSLRAG